MNENERGSPKDPRRAAGESQSESWSRQPPLPHSPPWPAEPSPAEVSLPEGLTRSLADLCRSAGWSLDDVLIALGMELAHVLALRASLGPTASLEEDLGDSSVDYE